MPFVSLLKEKFAIAPIQDRESVVSNLATANTEDARYFQGLLILQKIYNEVMKQEDPIKIREATHVEITLLNEMQNHLDKMLVRDERYTELNTRLNLLIYPFRVTKSIEFIKNGLCLDLVTQEQEQQQVERDSIPTKATKSILDNNLINGKKLLKDSFENFKTSGDIDVDILAFPLIKALIAEQNSITSDLEIILLKKIFMHPTEKLFGNDILDRLVRLWQLQKSDCHQESNGWQLENLPFHNFTLAQLDYLIEHASNIVLLEEYFVRAYLEKLIPAQYYNSYSNDKHITFWDDDEDILNKYLGRLEEFSQKLPNVYFQLKSAVKFYQLRVDVVRQTFEETRLIQFLTGASNEVVTASPIPSKIQNPFSISKGLNNVNENNASAQVLIDLPLLMYHTISEQDKLFVITEYLTGLITQGKLTVSIDTLGAYIDYHNVIKPLYSKLMLTLSSYIQESWVIDLGSEKYGELVAESSVSFSPSTLNKSVKRTPEDTINLTVRTKNVPSLSIRVFQINMENYARLHMNDTEKTIAEKNNQIDLDGLCPTWEKDVDLSSEPAIHLKTNNFAFGAEGFAPEIFEGRGLWVIEFVGGQNQCRAIIQKGYLRHIIQESTAGHIVRILDESNQAIVNSKVWCDNQYYQADKSGNILIPYLPFEDDPKTNNMLLVSNSDAFCEAVSIYQQPEKYQIEADFYVNPEMVSFNKKATVIVNPRLTINGVSASFSLLENTSLHIECTNVDGVKNSCSYRHSNQKSSSIYFEFMVPDRLSTLDFTLQAKVKSLNGTVQAIEVKHSNYYVTPVDNSGVPASVHLRKTDDDNYYIHVFGKNGEPKKDHEITIKLKHAFTQYRKVEATLKTNQEGLIELGKLVDIQWIEYSNIQGAYKQWTINNEEQSLMTPAICVSADTPFKVACSTALSSDLLYSLYKTGARQLLIENVSHLIKKHDDHVAISALPEGEYMLYLVSNNEGEKQIKCTVIDQLDFSHSSTSTEESDTKDYFWFDWVIGKNTYAKQNGIVLHQALEISDMHTDDSNNVIIHLRNWSSKAFIVATTSTFVPTSLESLKRLMNNRSLTRPLAKENMAVSKSSFLNDKQLGEEYQYVLNRARSEKWVGSNLDKPSLLMHPQKNASTTFKPRILKTEMVTGDNVAGFRTAMKKQAVECFNGLCYAENPIMFEQTESSLSFLNHSSPIVILSVPDNGIVTIDRAALGFGGNFLQVVSISGEQVVSKNIVLPSLNDSPLFRYNDLRQKSSSNKALIRSKVVKDLEPGEKVIIGTNEYEIIDSFEKLFNTIQNISKVSNTLNQEFEYLKTWTGLGLEKKLELYEEKVCHELKFWLKRKDPTFFKECVQPAIESKVQKKFMDLYLIDGDLSEFSSNMYKYGQLSTVEKTLLATTQSTEFLKTVLRSFKETFDEKIVDDQSDTIFESILSGSLLNVPGGSLNTYDAVQVDVCSAMPMSASYPLTSPAYSPTSSMYPSAPFTFGSSAGLGAKSFSNASLHKTSKRKDLDDQEYSKVEDNDDEFQEAAIALREKAKQRQSKVVYKFTEQTSEWVETGYYNEQDTIVVKRFWIDYLQYHLNYRDEQRKSFLPDSFVYCISNITEILYVLSLIDLPFQSEINCVPEATTINTENSAGNTTQLSIFASSGYPLMVFCSTLTESTASFSSVSGNSKNNLMLAQELFIFDENTPIDSDECIKINPLSTHLDPGVEYGSHVIISNVSSKTLTCQITVQIPTGAVPCKKTSYCKSKTISINAYSTWHEVTGTFYFPSDGKFTIVPVTVSSLSGDKLLGKIEAIDISVIEKASASNNSQDDYNYSNQQLSLSSWPVLANTGSNPSIIAFLEMYKKLDRIDFNLIGWRMKEPSFARQVFDVLSHQRYFFSAQLWKYGVYHQFDDIIRDLLNYDSSSLLDNVGHTFDSPLISKKREDHAQVFDYYPLLNARAHPLKSTSHEILNNQFYKQYNDFLTYLGQQTSQPSNTDLVILTLYLILQDRIGDAQSMFTRIKYGENTVDCQVQIDYLDGYLKTRIPVTDQTEQQIQDLNSVKDIASKYKNFGVLKWRKLFAELYEFVCEVERGDSDIVRGLSEQSTKRIQSEPVLDFEIDQQLQELVVQSANIKYIDIKYHEMNIEVMFSTNPFMNDRISSMRSNTDFTCIKPSFSSRVNIPEKIAATSETDTDGDYNMIGVGQVNSVQTLNIPFSGGNKNLFVEISSTNTQNTIKRSQAYFSHNLYTHIADSFGIVRVLSRKTKRPLAGAYVKVYARMKHNRMVHFWKDGYTGLNGVFDYISVTEGNALIGGEETDLKTLMNDKVDKLSILIMSAEEGSVVKEVYPPLT